MAEVGQQVQHYIEETVASKLVTLSPCPNSSLTSVKKYEWELILEERWGEILEWFDLDPSMSSPSIQTTVSAVLTNTSRLTLNFTSSEEILGSHVSPPENDEPVEVLLNVTGQQEHTQTEWTEQYETHIAESDILNIPRRQSSLE